MFTLKKKMLPLCVAISSVGSMVAHAEPSVLEEVIVTAQMRSQTLQEVPVSVSAFTGDYIKKAGLTSFKDVFALTPGLSGQTEDSFFDAVSVRGINNNSFGSGTDPSFGVYLDGVYQSRAGAVPTMFDMERVEVIKGPQGTLFGRNAASGAMSMVVKKPEDEFGGEISAGVGEEGRKEISLSVDLPVSDDLKVRLSGMHEEEDGHIRNLTTGDKLGGREVDALRLVSVYSGWEDTTLTLVAQYEDRDGDGTVYRALSTVGDYNEVNNNDRGDDRSTITDLIATLETSIGEYSFTSITGYKEHEYYYAEDFDGTEEFRDFYSRDQDGKYFSQEFRLGSDATADVNWVLGASYYHEDLDADFLGATDEDILCDTVMVLEYEYDSGDALGCAAWTGFAPDDMDDAFGSSDPGDYGADMVEYSFTKAKSNGWAIFGDLEWTLSDVNSIGFGVRYTHDEKKYDVNSPWPDSYTGTWNYLPLYTDGTISGDESWNNLSGRITFNHALSDSVNTYASISTGYKNGGFNYLNYDLAPDYDADDSEYSVDSSNAAPAKVDEETVVSYEIGLKGKFFDDSLMINAAAFHYTYDDLQQNFESPESGSGYITSNVGKTEGQGIDLDARWLINDNWDLVAGLSYLDTDFSGAPIELCESCDGNKMAFSPEYSGALVLTYNTDLAVGNLAVSGEYTFTDDQFSELENIKESQVDAYQVFNVRATLTFADEAWSATVYADNLFDEEYYLWGYADDGWLNPSTQTDPSRPRIVGARVDYRF